MSTQVVRTQSSFIQEVESYSQLADDAQTAPHVDRPVRDL